MLLYVWLLHRTCYGQCLKFIESLTAGQDQSTRCDYPLLEDSVVLCRYRVLAAVICSAGDEDEDRRSTR
jgi:hypothetical protein